METKNYYALKRYHAYVQGEQKAWSAKFADPLTLNFKIIIDYDKPYGLLADENNVNSALAYLLRIGEKNRYNMLKVWIQNLKTLIKNYEFLFISVEGLDIIQNFKPYNMFTDEEKLQFILRETADMRVMSLLTNYRQIWYDNTRGVEVLPVNLRRFDLSVIVFSSGYFNMLFYDDVIGGKDDEDSINRLVFPTVKKLSDGFFNYDGIEKFNHVIYNLYDCQIDNQESGKSFASEVLNEQNSDFVKVPISLIYKFANYSGRFSNISGTVDYGALLASVSALHTGWGVYENEVTLEDERHPDNNRLRLISDETKFGDQVKKLIQEKKDDFTWNNIKDAGRKIGTDTLKTLEQKLNNLESKILDKTSVIGNILNKVSVDYGAQMIKNTIDLGINTIEKQYIDDPLTRVNNMLFNNFSNNLVDAFKREGPPKGATLMTDEQQPKNYPDYEGNETTNTNSPNGVKYQQNIGNVFRGTGF